MDFTFQHSTQPIKIKFNNSLNFNSIKQFCNNNNIPIYEGCYSWTLGPTYETPSEIKMLRTLGADMVGMSTVPESIAANHLGIKVGGLSCITNMAAGIKNETLKHEDIKEQALKVMEYFSSLLKNAIIRIGVED